MGRDEPQLTELEKLYIAKCQTLDRIYAHETEGENLRVGRKELEDAVEVLWLVYGEMRRKSD